MKSKLIYYSALTIMLIWMFWGVFPLVCYESDAMHIIAGCNTLVSQEQMSPHCIHMNMICNHL